MKLRKYLRSGDCATLDAGCGNGAFSYYACSLGNSVLGINIDLEQVRKCEEFRDFLDLDRERCGFKVHNIYDVLSLGQKFDQIICFETLEHLKADLANHKRKLLHCWWLCRSAKRDCCSFVQ